MSKLKMKVIHCIQRGSVVIVWVERIFSPVPVRPKWGLIVHNGYDITSRYGLVRNLRISDGREEEGKDTETSSQQTNKSFFKTGNKYPVEPQLTRFMKRPERQRTKRWTDFLLKTSKRQANKSLRAPKSRHFSTPITSNRCRDLLLQKLVES